MIKADYLCQNSYCTLAQRCVEVCTCYQSDVMTGRDHAIRFKDILRHFYQTTISSSYTTMHTSRPLESISASNEVLVSGPHCINRPITGIENSNACTDYLSLSQTHTDTIPAVSTETLDSIVIVLSCCRTPFRRADWFFHFSHFWEHN